MELAVGILALAPSLAAQSFLQPKVIPTGNWPAGVYSADVNGDGIPDLLYLDQGATATRSITHVLVGDGKGGFQTNGQIGTFGTSIAVGDFAGNNSVQIASVLASGPTTPPQTPVCSVSAVQVSITQLNPAGAPAGSMQATVCASGPKPPVFGNLLAAKLRTGQGADLLMTDAANNLLYEISIPASGTTGAPVVATFPLASGAGPIATSDLNGDGNLDVVVNGQTRFAADVLLGNGSGGLAFAGSVAGTSGIHSLLLLDVNYDGRPDLIAEGANGRIDVFTGNGNGTFQATSSGGSGALDGTTGDGGHLIALADLNHDGLLDAITATPIGISTLIQTMSSSYALPGIYNAGPGRAAYAVADFNQDGNVDLAVDSPEGIAILFGNADGSFQTSRAYPAGKPVSEAALMGIDAVADLGSGQFGLLQGVGNGTFSAATAYAPANPATLFGAPVPTGFTVPNSLITPGQTTAPVLSSTFGGTVATSAGGLGFPATIGSIATADLDGDGNQDLIVTYANLAADRTAPTASAPNYIYLWFGSGGGQYLASAKHPVNPVVLTPSRNFYQVAVADVTGDKIPDLILSDGYILSVQAGHGDGTFGVETHYLAGQGLNTISIADLNHDGTLDLVVANGGTVWGNTAANLNRLPAAQDVDTGGVTVLLNHVTQPTATISGSVAASPEPSTFGNAFSVTATITPSLTNNNPVTGTFTFAVDGVIAGTASISGLAATLTVPASIYAGLTVGTHTLTAVYSGDPNWAMATFTATHNVSLIPTTTSLLLCVDPPGSNFPCGNPIGTTPLISPITMYYGQTLDGVAAESSLNLTGTITFFSSGSIFCVLNANLQQGSQTCPPNSGVFPAGTTTVTAVYSGDSVYAPSTSNPIVVTVLPDTTTATLVSSPNPSTSGQPVTFTASIQGNFAPGAGQVIFLDGNATIGTATLDATGHATLRTSSLTAGTHQIRVAFPGSANFNSVTSATLDELVMGPASVLTVTALASNVNPSGAGMPVTFTATVSVVGSASVSPTGTITFLDASFVIGMATLNPTTGIATFTTSALAVGSHPITASYSGATGVGSGTQSLAASGSAILTQIVASQASPSFVLTATPTPVTIGVGDTGILLVRVQALGGFSQPVNLTCTGLPQETTCVFVQPQTPPGGGLTTLQVAVSAPHNCGSNTPYFVSSASGPGTTAKVALSALLGGGLLFAGIRRRRRMLVGTLFLALISLCGFAMISGCGACTDLGTKPGVYSLTVVGTAQGSTEVESQKIPLTVTIP